MQTNDHQCKEVGAMEHLACTDKTVVDAKANFDKSYFVIESDVFKASYMLTFACMHGL